MIVFFQVVAITALMPLRFGLAIGGLVFFLAFSPRSLGIILGDGGLSLTFARLAIPLLFVVYLISKVGNGSAIRIGKRPIFKVAAFQMLFFLSSLKLVTTLYNGVSPVYAIEDLLFSSGVFAAFYLMATQRLTKTAMRATVCAVIISGLIVLVEYAAKQPLHSVFADQRILDDGALQGRVRNNSYRVQGIFDNPLSLAEYICYALPITLALHSCSRGIWRFGAKIAVPLIFLSLILTGSRSAILVGLISCLSYFLALNWEKYSKASRGVLIAILIALVAYVLALSLDFLFGLIAEAEGTSFFLVEDAKKRSSLSRALQYSEVVSALSERPLVGFGVLQNFANELDDVHRIDNYYLRIGLEAGYMGILLFVVFLAVSFRSLNQLCNGYKFSKLDVPYRAMSIGLLITFASYKLFLSMPTNNLYVYIVLGLIFGTLSRRALID